MDKYLDGEEELAEFTQNITTYLLSEKNALINSEYLLSGDGELLASADADDCLAEDR